MSDEIKYNWQKVKDSDFEWKYKVIGSIPFYNQQGRFIYYNLLDPKPRKVKKTPIIVEVHEDGHATHWSGFGVWGPLGRTLRSDIALVPLKTKADFKEAQLIERLLLRSLESQNAMFQILKVNERMRNET